MSTASIAIDLPPSWYEVPTDPERLDSWWGEVDGLATVDPDTLHEAQVRLRTLVVEARRDGLVFAAAMLAVVEPEEATDEALDSADGDTDGSAEDGGDGPHADLVTASVFIAATHDAGLDGTVSTFALQTLIRQDEMEGDRRVLADPDVVYLGGHEALRVVELELLPDEETDSDVPVLAVTYFMATEDRNGALQIGFRTPAVWLYDDMVGLFHDIAETFRVID